MLKFGMIDPKATYQDRFGTYGIIFNKKFEVCILKVNSGYFLPGGGTKKNESSVENLHREVLEETGFIVEIRTELGIAEQFLFANQEGYIRKICTFYLCSFKDIGTDYSEIDHQVSWNPLDSAMNLLKDGSAFKWALTKAVDYLNCID